MRNPILTLSAAIMLAAFATPSLAQETAKGAPQVDYSGFQELTNDVSSYRAQRLIGVDVWMAKADEPDTLILDTRSASAYQMGHIEGAVNLPFSDFTDEKLAKVIGDNPNRTILIYCNNNFSDNIAPIISKRAPLALNIPTFINLVGYGYRNVWELGDEISIKDPEARWVKG